MGEMRIDGARPLYVHEADGARFMAVPAADGDL